MGDLGQDAGQAGSAIVVDGVSVPFEKDLTGSEVISFINERFPTEASLDADLDGFVSSLRSAIEAHDAELANIVRAERHGGAKSAHQVASVGTVLEELTQAVNEVDRLAKEAESAVDEATAEIRPLDAARRNIAETTKTLGDLVALEDAVARCEHAVQAESKTAISELMASGDGTAILRQIAESLPGLGHLKGLVRVPELIERSTKTRVVLREAVLAEFRTVLESSNRPGEMAVLRLKAVCAMADELEPDVRQEVVGMFLSARSTSYSAYFDKHPAELEQCDRRFAWMRTELRAYREAGWANVFPGSWHVIERLCEVVLGMTRNVLTGQLSRRKGGDEVDLLLLALQRSIEFERELDKHFDLDATHSTDTGQPDALFRKSFVGVVTSDFEQYMGTYVDNEDRSLRELVDRLVREENWKRNRAKQETVLASSTELFLQIKRTVRRCALLTTNKTFFDLHKVFKGHLKAYCAALGQQVQQRKVNRPPEQAAPTGGVASPPVDPELWEIACGVLATAEYCATTVEQLEESLKSQVDQIYCADLSLSNERSAFIDVVSRGLRTIVRFTEIEIEAPLATMLDTNWMALQEVGDSSTYVGKLRDTLEQIAKNLRANLSKAQYRVYYERFAKSFLPRYHNLVFRCSNRLTDVGAQQLLLDLATIKGIVLKLAGPESNSSSPFAKSVNREVAKTEVVLKIVLTPLPSIVDTYLTLVPDGTLQDFQKILTLRGVNASKVAALTHDFSRVAGIDETAEAARQIQSNVLSGSHMTTTPAPPVRHPVGSSLSDRRVHEDGAMDSMKKLLGRLDLSAQLEQTAGKFKDRFTT